MERLRFGYRHSQIIWSARTEEECIVVGDSLYERILREQLAARGITAQAYSEIMRPAQEIWEKQCAAIERVQRDLTFWKSVSGVEMYSVKRMSCQQCNSL